LREPRDFLGRLAGLAAPDTEHVLATLGPLFAGADFRPESLMSVCRAAAHLCRWCLALFVRSGGAPPAQAPRARPEQPLEERKVVRAPKAVRAPKPIAEPITAAVMDCAPKGELRVLSLSGEIMATLGVAQPQWTRREIVQALKKSRPLPDGKVYKLVCGTSPMKGATTLAEFGADPTRPEGAEITAILGAVPEEVRLLLEAATEAVDCITLASLAEFKAMKNPPPGAMLACVAVYAAMHPDVPRQQVSWRDCQQMLSKRGSRGFLSELLDFDKDADPEGVQCALAPFVQDEMFTVQIIARASLAAAGFCQWCRAIHAYSAVSAAAM